MRQTTLLFLALVGATLLLSDVCSAKNIGTQNTKQSAVSAANPEDDGVAFINKENPKSGHVKKYIRTKREEIDTLVVPRFLDTMSSFFTDLYTGFKTVVASITNNADKLSVPSIGGLRAKADTADAPDNEATTEAGEVTTVAAV